MKRQCFDSTGLDAQRQALQDALERLDREAAERAASQAGSPALNRVTGAVHTQTNTSTPLVHTQVSATETPAISTETATSHAATATGSNHVIPTTPIQVPSNRTATPHAATPARSSTSTPNTNNIPVDPTFGYPNYQPYYRGRGQGRGRERGIDSRGRLFTVMACVAHDRIFCQQCMTYVASSTYWSRHPELPDPE